MADTPHMAVNGCRWCGTGERQHCSRYTAGVGYHVYAAPTDAQRKERLLAASGARAATAVSHP